MRRIYGPVSGRLFEAGARVRNGLMFHGGDLLRSLKPNDYSYKELESSILPAGYFESTNICNAACVFCAYRKVKQPKGVMCFDMFKKTVDEYYDIVENKGVVNFTPTVGDPLVDPELVQKLEYAVSKGFKGVLFYTNGILLNQKERYKTLIDLRLSMIHLSVSGFEKAEYEKVYQVKRYDEVLSGIRNLLKYNKEQGEPVSIIIDFRSMRRLHEVLTLPDFVNYIKPYLSEKVQYTYMADYDNWGGMIPQEELAGVMTSRAIPKVKNVPCRRLWSFSVLYDGTLRLCGCRLKTTAKDDLVVGHVDDAPLKKLIYGKKAQKIRESFVSGKGMPDVCKDCTMYVPATTTWAQGRGAD